MIDQSLLDLPILHETLHEIVVVKPSGMAVELTSDPRGTSLISRVRRACPPSLDAKLPHRLDRVARGLVLVALTPEAIAFHNEQIRARKWKKYYLARALAPRDRSIEALLGQHKAYLKRARGRAEIVRSGGKPAFLEILAAHPAPGRAGQYHLLIKLLTGRFHQLRAMLANLGAPLADDPLYGTDPPHHWRRRDLYLEHVALRFTDYAHQTPRAVHWRDDPDRESVAPALRAQVEALAQTLAAGNKNKDMV